MVGELPADSSLQGFAQQLPYLEGVGFAVCVHQIQKNHPEGWFCYLFLFMTILAQAFLTLVGCNFMSLFLLSARHTSPTLFLGGEVYDGGLEFA